VKLHVVLDVSPEDKERPANSEVILEELEAQIENDDLEIDGRVYTVKVLGSGKTARDSLDSMQMRRQR
jgi:hypothetical protein